MKVRWGILAGGLVVVGGLLAVLASGFGGTTQGVSNNLLGRPAPPFAMEVLGERETIVRTAALTGAPVVLNFWSTWCQPCVLEHPHLLAAAQEFGPRGVKFYGVLYNDEPQKAERFLAEKGQGFPVLHDPLQRVAIDYGVTGVPETFVLDKEGRIAHKFIGPVSVGELQAVLRPLL
ncbi:MAG: redoxin domain-containing protein [Deltaproteobacteria bacterium]|jgi:cytochrome c biogenesis protein CcmG/thiol:disulfide interchange protein DsbE|nr:redoxin domain-containing protein [Deltaproteobacteria bacterium]